MDWDFLYEVFEEYFYLIRNRLIILLNCCNYIENSKKEICGYNVYCENYLLFMF